MEIRKNVGRIPIRGKTVDNPGPLFLARGPGGSKLPSTRLHLADEGETDEIETLRRNGPPPYTAGNLALTQVPSTCLAPRRPPCPKMQTPPGPWRTCLAAEEEYTGKASSLERRAPVLGE